MTPKHLQALAKMLPEKVQLRDNEVLGAHLAWKSSPPNHSVSHTELLHLCWLVEEELNWEQYARFARILMFANDGDATGELPENYQMRRAVSANPEWRIEALAKVRGVEV